MQDSLSLGGDVRLVSGRYLQDFNVRNLVLTPRINESASRPFWEGVPLLENLGLGLRVRTLGDATRRAIVDRLAERPQSVSRLAEPLGVTLTANRKVRVVSLIGR